MSINRIETLIVLGALLILAACGDPYVIKQRTVIAVPEQGPQGPAGDRGPAGVEGPQGFASVAEQAPASALACPNGGITIVMATDVDRSRTVTADDWGVTSFSICNGAPGQPAQPSPYAVAKAISPCGPASAQYKEVILLLADGSLLSSFSDNASGQNTRLTLLPDGSYVNTDGSGCSFTVSTSGSTRSLVWAGGSETWAL